MRSLYESLFDIDDNIDKIDKDIEKQIRKFLYNNFTNFSQSFTYDFLQYL